MAVKPPRWCGKCRAVHAGDCPNRMPWQKAAHQKSGRGGRPWQRLRKEVFERDGYLCQQCLQNGITTVVTLHGSLAGICDHIVPISQGGADTKGNLQTLCKQCSDIKTQDESNGK